jgi:glycosyltransferase involved in cell wall biosynthesis
LAEDVGASGQMVTLAAMQLGKAVVVPDLPVVSQYVEDGISGVVYELSSDASLRAAIAKLYADEQLLRRLGAAAQKRYSEWFTKSAFHQRLIEVLLQFASRHNG